MKKVLLIRSNPVNPDPPVEKVANSLLSFGFEVTIIGWDRNNQYKYRKSEKALSNGNCIFISFGIPAQFGKGFKGNLIPLIKFESYLLLWLVKNYYKYDAVHAFDFDTGFIVSCLKKMFDKKMVYHVLDYYSDSHFNNDNMVSKIISHLEDNVISIADATILCNEKRIEQIRNSKPKQVVIIHNTPDISYSYNDNCLELDNNGKIRIVYVGILAPGRLLLELCEIVSQYPQIELHIAGFGILEKSIIEYSKEFDNIYYYGKISYSNTLSLENMCDVMMATYDPNNKNNKYAAPNKFYEALMLGKPIIMSLGTGFDDIINDYGIGQLIVYSKKGLEQGLNELISRKSEWEHISFIEKELYDNNYSWDIMAHRLDGLYSSLLL